MTEQSSPILTWTFAALFALWGTIKFVATVYLFQLALAHWKRSLKARRNKRR